MVTRIPLLAIAFVCLATVMQSCHTSPFQNVDSQIQDEWTLMPVENGNTTVWKFDNGTLSISVNGDPVTFKKNDGTEVKALTYSVDNSVSNHYVYIDVLNQTGTTTTSLPAHLKKYLVVKSKSDELYLESIGDTGHKGEAQFHFFKK